MYEINDLTLKYKDEIVNNAYVATNTGVVTLLSSVSYIKIPVVENTTLYFLVMENPYTNVPSHSGAFKDINDNYISNFIIDTLYTDALQIIKVPVGAVNLYINFQTIYFDRFALLNIPGYLSDKIKPDLLTYTDLKI